MLDIIKEEKINSYIESETQDSYSIELYKELLKKDIDFYIKIWYTCCNRTIGKRKKRP